MIWYSRFNLNTLQNESTSELFKDKLETQLAKIRLSEIDHNLIHKIENILNRVAIKTIGKYRNKKQPWMINEILDLCDTSRNLKSVKKHNPGNIAKYRDINI